MKLTFAKMAFRVFVFQLLLLLGANPLSANFYINEIYFDPPESSGDDFAEYIELRGDPNMDLSNHYLIFLENEIASEETGGTADPGVIDYMFDLGALPDPRLGSNGYLVLRQAGNAYNLGLPGSVSQIPAATRDFVNTAGGLRWMDGSGNSTVGFSGEDGKRKLENSGFTAMLIRNDGAPEHAPFIPTDGNSPPVDLDDDDDKILDPNGLVSQWHVYDSIGVNSEASDVNGFLYGEINFSAGSPDPNLPGQGFNTPGTIFIDVGYEIEYIARWGDSTGSAPEDWHVTNLTNDTDAGFNGIDDYRQAGDPHGVGSSNQYVETSQGVPYATVMTDTMGSSNLFILDGDVNPTFDGEEYVFDGRVDAFDFLHIQRNLGFGTGLDPNTGAPVAIVGATATRQHGDTTRDRTVSSADISVWGDNYGSTLSNLTAFTAVPEPSTLLLMLAGCSFTTLTRRR